MIRKFFSAFPFVFGGIAASTFALFSNPVPTVPDAPLLRERVIQTLENGNALGAQTETAPLPVIPSLEGNTASLNLDAFQYDTDSDGLSDFVESFYGTDPRNSDTDGDSYLDGEEVRYGYSPLGLGKLEP